MAYQLSKGGVIMARVLIQHEVKYNDKGHPTGVKYTKVGHVVLNLTHLYMHKDAHGNDVGRVSCGDTWSIRRVNNPNYEYVTI